MQSDALVFRVTEQCLREAVAKVHADRRDIDELKIVMRRPRAPTRRNALRLGVELRIPLFRQLVRATVQASGNARHAAHAMAAGAITAEEFHTLFVAPQRAEGMPLTPAVLDADSVYEFVRSAVAALRVEKVDGFPLHRLWGERVRELHHHTLSMMVLVVAVVCGDLRSANHLADTCPSTVLHSRLDVAIFPAVLTACLQPGRERFLPLLTQFCSLHDYHLHPYGDPDDLLPALMSRETANHLLTHHGQWFSTSPDARYALWRRASLHVSIKDAAAFPAHIPSSFDVTDFEEELPSVTNPRLLACLFNNMGIDAFDEDIVMEHAFRRYAAAECCEFLSLIPREPAVRMLRNNSMHWLDDLLPNHRDKAAVLVGELLDQASDGVLPDILANMLNQLSWTNNAFHSAVHETLQRCHDIQCTDAVKARMRKCLLFPLNDDLQSCSECTGLMKELSAGCLASATEVCDLLRYVRSDSVYFVKKCVECDDYPVPLSAGELNKAVCVAAQHGSFKVLSYLFQLPAERGVSVRHDHGAALRGRCAEFIMPVLLERLRQELQIKVVGKQAPKKRKRSCSL